MFVSRRFDGFRFDESFHLVVEQFGAAAGGGYFKDRAADFVTDRFTQWVAPFWQIIAMLFCSLTFHSYPSFLCFDLLASTANGYSFAACFFRSKHWKGVPFPFFQTDSKHSECSRTRVFCCLSFFLGRSQAPSFSLYPYYNFECAFWLVFVRECKTFLLTAITVAAPCLGKRSLSLLIPFGEADLLRKVCIFPSTIYNAENSLFSKEKGRFLKRVFMAAYRK